MTLYAPPAVPGFPAGYGPLPADFNTWVQATLGFLTTSVVFRAEQTSAQTIGTGLTTLTFDTVLEDPYSGWAPGTNRWTAPYTGLYHVTVSCSIATAAIIFQTSLEVTGTTQYETTDVTLSGLTLGGGNAAAIVPLIGGSDYVTGIAQASSSSPTDVSSPGRFPTMEIAFISQ